MTHANPNRTQSERSDETRGRILGAALKEFSSDGLAGARTDRIAAAAGVNKALLYYYFDSKEKLYVAALETIAEKVVERSLAVFRRNASPGERILRTALDHFDRILAQREFQSLMQQEMMRLHKGESGALAILVQRIFGPLQAAFDSMIHEGIGSGELVAVDFFQLQLAALGANVFYFLSAPVWRLIKPIDPFAPRVLADRRKALVHYLGQAIFSDRRHGERLAKKVLADSPMPALHGDVFGRKNERTQ